MKKVKIEKVLKELKKVDLGAEVKISMNQYFTVGEIFRLKLLKNHEGKPYGDKSTVSRIAHNLNGERKMTPWGMGWSIPGSEITRWNKQWE
jgi:hypothetical protein